MKKITEETLNAIQENVRTRETQELDYRRKNLFKGSWKDFEIKDLKPNLIPNGWDSFVPYGSGKGSLIINKDNFRNAGINTKGVISELNDGWEIKSFETAGTMHCFIDYESEKKIREYSVDEVFVLIDINFIEVSAGQSISFCVNAGYKKSKDLTALGKDLYLVNYTLSESTKPIFHIKIPSNTHAKINKVVILEKETIPYVEKTPLGNGLTRIQTWGGNGNTKLVMNLYHDVETDLSSSMYIENLKEYRLSVDMLAGEVSHIEAMSNQYITSSKETNRLRIAFYAGQRDLDFIASDPIINEGDKPNPTMIVTDLDDGREHVQVYGATKDTKLVYSGNEGFIGEDYGLKTTIENNGIDLDFSTSLTEEKKRIEKGENKVNLQGELSTKLSIEIGVPSE